MSSSINESEYWNNYYKNNFNVARQPSLFAMFCMEKYIKEGNRILELGCGNGRDAIYFASKGIEVVALDSSSEAIALLKKADYANIDFCCTDFVNANKLREEEGFDAIYSRFTIHAISKSDQKVVIKNVFYSLKKNGVFMVETRSVNDEIFGQGKKIDEDTYVKDGHSRRFIRKEELEKELVCAGFEIIYSEESTEFAPYKDERPAVLRVIARKDVVDNARVAK